jgi:hypothetical protein
MPGKHLVISPLYADSPLADVRVQFPGEWGQSSRRGTLDGVKLGFSFTVEFSPEAAYFFSGWEAVLTEDWQDYLNSENRDDQRKWIKKTADPADEENKKMIDIIEKTDAAGKPTGRAEITVLSTRSLTLVPHCYQRPSVKTNRLNDMYEPKLKNYPINLDFSLPIERECIDDAHFRDNFRFSAKRGFGSGAVLPDIGDYYEVKSIDGSHVRIGVKDLSLLDPEFAGLLITLRLNAEGIYWKSPEPEGDTVSMNPGDGNRKFSYSISSDWYNKPPEAKRLYAAASKDGPLFKETELSGDSGCYVQDENGERAVYILFDKKDLDDIIDMGRQFSVRFDKLVRITEMESGTSEAVTAIDGSSASLPEPYRTLAERYGARESGRVPYIARYALKTNANGKITLSVQPEDSLGNRQSSADAGKVAVNVYTAAPDGVGKPDCVFDAATGTLNLTWVNPPGTANIKLGHGAQGVEWTSSPVDKGTGNSHTINVAWGKTYGFTFTITDMNANTRVQDGGFYTVPSFPGGLRLDSSDDGTTAVLKWDLLEGMQYKVYRSELEAGSSEDVIGTLGEGVDEYTDPDLDPDKDYWYKISAFNAAMGESLPSAAVKKDALPSMSTLTGLVVTNRTANSIRLSWSAPPDAIGYRVYRAAETGGTYHPTGGSLVSPYYNDTGLEPDTEYWYKASVVTAAGEGPQSAAIPAQTKPASHYYVRAGAAGNGSSWSKASGDLQAMIDAAYNARIVNGTVSVVHVGAGIYKPKYAPEGSPVTMNLTNTRDRAFFLREGVQVLGGYAALGENIDEAERKTRFYTYGDYQEDNSRRPGEAKNVNHRAILSGDFNGNDGGNVESGFTNMTENAYHVVLSVNIPDDGKTVLDGFIVKGGNADGSGSAAVEGRSIARVYGGGMYNDNASPILGNVVFTGNSSSNSGGGMYNYTNDSGTCSPVLTNVTIAENKANSGGGMYSYVLYSGTCSPILTGVTIAGNKASSGGGMFNDSANSGTCSPVLTNVTITGNTATSSGGGMSSSCSPFSSSNISLVLTNVIITGNSASSGGGGMSSSGSNYGNISLVLTSVTIAGNSGNIGGGMYNSFSSLALTNVTIAGNRANSDRGGGMYNSSSSLVLTNVNIAGHRANSGAGGGMYNNNASPQIRNSIIWGNTASSNPAGIYNTGSY